MYEITEVLRLDAQANDLNISKLSDRVKCYLVNHRVYIGPGMKIFGKIELGNNVTIRAGSAVIHSIPDNCVVVGNPARVVKILNN